MLTQFRRRRADPRARVRQLNRSSGYAMSPGNRTMNRRKHLAKRRLGMIHDFRKRPNRRTWYPGRTEALDPFRHVALPENGLQDLFERVPVPDAARVGLEIGVGLEIAAANHPAERRPELLT